jgi:hypothetical protein
MYVAVQYIHTSVVIKKSHTKREEGDNENRYQKQDRIYVVLLPFKHRYLVWFRWKGLPNLRE